MGLEKAFVKIFIEAGGKAKPNVPIGSLQVAGVDRNDQRRLDGVGWGLPLFDGVKVVMDATIRAPLTSNGLPALNADRVDGSTFVRARYDKKSAYPELHNTHSCRFLTLACGTGGRWSQECEQLVRGLAKHKGNQYPEALRKSMQLTYTNRFWCLLSVAALKGIAASLEGIGEIDDTGALLREPVLEEVLAGCDVPPYASRLA